MNVTCHLICSLLLTVIFYSECHAQEFNTESPDKTSHTEVRNETIEKWTIPSGLLDLDVTRINLPGLEHTFHPYTGAMLVIDDQVIVADKTGSFFLVSLANGSASVDKLPINIDLKINKTTAILSKIMSGNIIPPRITDLHLLKDQRKIAVAYNFWDEGTGCFTLRVATMDIPLNWTTSDLPGWRTLYDTQPCRDLGGWNQMSGGRMAQASDNKLLLSVGFPGDSPQRLDHLPGADHFPQKTDNDYGKIIEIDLVDGSSRIVSIGHRNPQGLALDHLGRIWETEHGAQGGDELNLIREANNYGFPIVTLGTVYNWRYWPLSNRQGRHDSHSKPVFAWVPSIAVSNLIEINNFHPRWDGDLLVTSLKSTSIHRLRLSENEIPRWLAWILNKLSYADQLDPQVLYEEQIQLDERIRDIGQYSDGSIILFTDNGNLIMLSAALLPNQIDARIQQLEPEVQNILAGCRECHQFAAYPNQSDTISLWRIHGRAPAKDKQSLYSNALKSMDMVWNSETLDQFLAGPQDMIPGTTMQYKGINDIGVRKQVVEFLKQLH